MERKRPVPKGGEEAELSLEREPRGRDRGEAAAAPAASADELNKAAGEEAALVGGADAIAQAAAGKERERRVHEGEGEGERNEKSAAPLGRERGWHDRVGRGGTEGGVAPARERAQREATEPETEAARVVLAATFKMWATSARNLKPRESCVSAASAAAAATTTRPVSRVLLPTLPLLYYYSLTHLPGAPF